jgi:hypothetical protein
MPYCPNCGNPVDQLPGTADVTEVVSAEVQIARINADRDIRLAELARSSDKDWNETRVEVARVEADADMVAAVAEAEVLGDVVAAGTESPPPAEIVNAPEADVEEVADDAPPPVETEGSEPPTPERKTIGLGAW